MIRSCASCAFFSRYPDTLHDHIVSPKERRGECRAMPPVENSNYPFTPWCHPIVDDSHWCGYWQDWHRFWEAGR